MPGKDTQIFTVTQLTREIRCMLEETFKEVWVEGEVSNYIVSSAGHTYFSLKDENSLLGCVLFKGNSARSLFTLENGLHVLCYGRVSVYDKRGQYQLYVSKIEPKGRGALQLAFEQLKEKLYKEGLFSEEAKKPLPSLPLSIGIVTSPTGAAIRDILKVTRRRFSNVDILIRPVRVQGDEAKYEIAQAIEELNEYNQSIEGEDEHPIDVMIVGRGGGSLEDLWPFNEEIVARAIYASKIPVISAVGHEVDYTISDFVADFRAPTPSAAAEHVVPLKKELKNRISEYYARSLTAIRAKVKTLEKAVTSLKDSYILREPINVFLRMRQEVDDLLMSISSGMTHLVELKSRDLTAWTGKLDALSPLAVLDRGYSIAFKNGKVIKNAASLKKGDLLETRFASGRAKSKVESTRE